MSAILSENPSHPRGSDVSAWSDVVSLAMRHGLGPLAYHRIERSEEKPAVPPGALHALRRSYVIATLRGRKLSKDAAAVLDALAKAGVEVMALKGLHLASVYYEEIGLRPMGDIDLLIREEQVRTAWDALCESGYTSLEVGTHYPGPQTCHHLPPLVKAGATPIELHWTIEFPEKAFRIDLKKLWERSRPVSVGSHVISGLSAEDLLLHLCLHATDHHLCQVPLRNIHDIALVLRRHRDRVDWTLLVRTARSFGTERAVFCGLLCAREVFGADVPHSILDSLVPDADKVELARMATATILAFDALPPWWLRLITAREPMLAKTHRLLVHAFPNGTPSSAVPHKSSLSERIRHSLKRSLDLLRRHHHLIVQLVLLRPTARAHLRKARVQASIVAWLSAKE